MTMMPTPAPPPIQSGALPAMRRAKIVFVIPAYNEEQNIASLLEQTRGTMAERGGSYQVIVVDDGSRDRTSQIAQDYAQRMPLTVVRHERNRGVGAVFRSGFLAALAASEAGDIIVTKEADNTSDLGILSAMLDRIEQGYEVVLASCYAKGGSIVGTTPLRMALSRAANLLLRLFFPIRGVCTYSSFYRAYTHELLARAHRHYGDRLMTEDGFVCMVELLVKLAAMRVRLVEVPVVLRGDRRNGRSKMNVVRTMLGYSRFCLKYWPLWGKTRAAASVLSA